MSHGIKILAGPRGEPLDETWLSFYDPDAPHLSTKCPARARTADCLKETVCTCPKAAPGAVTGVIDTTTDPAKALHFPDGGTALTFARQISGRCPERLDGRPNRPLMAFTLSFEAIESSRSQPASDRSLEEQRLDFPFAEVVDQASALIDQGFTIFQKFTCAGCGQRLSMDVPNRFYIEGTCNNCDAVTDIQKRGCNYVLVAGPISLIEKAVARDD